MEKYPKAREKAFFKNCVFIKIQNLEGRKEQYVSNAPLRSVFRILIMRIFRPKIDILV